jgi:signal transduction histidine kinase
MRDRLEYQVNVPSGERPGPRAIYYKYRWKLSILALFLLGALAVGAAVVGHHSTAFAISFFAFLIYAIVDIAWADKFRKSPQGPFYISWNVLGMLGPVFVYCWLVRGLGPDGPLSLWPLLSFPLYFVVRVYQHVGFVPRIGGPILLLLILAFILPAVFARDSNWLLNLSSAIWLFTTLVILAIYVRTMDYYRTRFDAYRQIAQWAGQRGARVEDVAAQFKILAAKLGLERLTLLEIFRPGLTSEERNLLLEALEIPAGAARESIRPPLYVRLSASSLPDDKNSDLKPWPLTKGLVAHSYRTRQSVFCDDNKSSEWISIYMSAEGAKAYGNTRSEYVVPIYQSPDGHILGFIDLQSDIPHGFGSEEKDYLQTLAVAISRLMVDARLAAQMQHLTALRRTLDVAPDEEAIFGRMARFAREHLDADVVTYYKLGFGNGWPLQPPMHLGAWFPKKLDDESVHRKSPPPVVLVSRWHELFQSISAQNSDLLPRDTGTSCPQDYFILREKIQSTAFLPVGTEKRRIGALFLNYRDHKAFSPADRLLLSTFRQTVIPYLDRARKGEDTGEGFEHEIFVLHDLLDRAVVSSDAMRSYMVDLRNTLSLGDPEASSEKFEKLFYRVREHIAAIRSADLKTSMDARAQLREGLEEAFGTATDLLEDKYAGRGLRWEFKTPGICDSLPVDFRLAIFSIVVEAAHNAIQKGDATAVNVTISRDDEHLVVRIQNDGTPWNPDQPVNEYSRYGIRSRLRLARETMKADSKWDLQGRVLIVTFPLLQTLDGSDPYEPKTSLSS